MDGAIGGLVFLVVLGLICAICYKHRDSLNNWLNTSEKPPSDSKLVALKGQVKIAREDLRKYQKRLLLQEDIKSAAEELEDMDKAETKD